MMDVWDENGKEVGCRWNCMLDLTFVTFMYRYVSFNDGGTF